MPKRDVEPIIDSLVYNAMTQADVTSRSDSAWVLASNLAHNLERVSHERGRRLSVRSIVKMRVMAAVLRRVVEAIDRLPAR